MIKFKILWLISIPLFVLHVLKEYFFNFPAQDQIIKALSAQFAINSTIAFLITQLFLLIVLLTPFLPNFKPKWPLVVVGIALLFESDHIAKTILAGDYYPGVITAIPLVGIGILFAILIFKKDEFSSN